MIFKPVSGKIKESSLNTDWENFINIIESGNAFIHVHTPTNPDGEIRGQIFLEGSVPCVIPNSSDWIITESCVISSNFVTPASILIQNNSVVTLNSGITLTIPSGENIIVVDGSGLKLIQGSTLNILS